MGPAPSFVNGARRVGAGLPVGRKAYSRMGPGAQAKTRLACYHEGMTGMQLYVKFMFALSIGLVGLGLVLTTMMETLFLEWDAPRELKRWWRRYTLARAHRELVRAEDILFELEKNYKDHRYERPSADQTFDRRREALREVREVDERLASPQGV